jgi:large subunit ribosomal protein L18
MTTASTIAARVRRANRTRTKIRGTAERPRLSVFRSVKHISVQLIDDVANRTLLTVTEKMLGAKAKGTKTERALAMGELVAEKAKGLNVTTVVFDRGASAFHGRVQAIAEGARKGGLAF